MTTTNITEELPCINRCVVPGTEQNESPEIMSATHGRFCENEYKQLRKALDKAPGVVQHVVSLLDAKGGADDRVDGSRDAPLPFNLQAFSDANETYQRLVFWSSVWAEEMKTQAPGPAARAWRNRSGAIVGLPNNVTPDQARYMVGVMCTWLKLHLDNILGLNLKDIADFREELQDVYRINARWPQKPRARYSDMPCPKDECKGKLAVYPPEEAGDDEKIVCESCGLWIHPDQYKFYVRLFNEIKAETDPIKRHLVKKYGRTA